MTWGTVVSHTRQDKESLPFVTGTAVFILPTFRPAGSAVCFPLSWAQCGPVRGLSGSEKPSVLCRRLFRGLLPMLGLLSPLLTPAVHLQNRLGMNKPISVARSSSQTSYKGRNSSQVLTVFSVISVWWLLCQKSHSDPGRTKTQQQFQGDQSKTHLKEM